MRVLVVGSGAREHAIAWKLKQSLGIDQVLVAPGNAGTQQIAQNVSIAVEDINGLVRLVQEKHIGLTVVGSEVPLAAGIADRFQKAGLLIFGPTQAAAQLEASKAWAKRLMWQLDVPTGTARIFEDPKAALDYVAICPLPIVVKADGLAQGKGVEVCHTRKQAIQAVKARMVEKVFGAEGSRVLLEEYLAGQEISVFAFVDGENVSLLMAACDYKRAGEDDTGPNTGGMGAYSPPAETVWTPELEHQVHTQIMEPVVGALAERGTPYRGVLYAGLILTTSGPKVIEFNCRLGDPEAQVVLPRLLRPDLFEVMLTIARDEDIRDISFTWDPWVCVGVVMASGGYPERQTYPAYQIEGLDEVDKDVFVFHAGTKQSPGSGKILTNGGRVLTLAMLGPTYDKARVVLYRNVDHIRFPDAFYRSDIALPGTGR